MFVESYNFVLITETSTPTLERFYLRVTISLKKKWWTCHEVFAYQDNFQNIQVTRFRYMEGKIDFISTSAPTSTLHMVFGGEWR